MKLGGVWEVGTFSPCQGQLFRAGRDPVLFKKNLNVCFIVRFLAFILIC